MGGLAAGGASHITLSLVSPSVFLAVGFLDAGLGLGGMVTLSALSFGVVPDVVATVVFALFVVALFVVNNFLLFCNKGRGGDRLEDMHTCKK